MIRRHFNDGHQAAPGGEFRYGERELRRRKQYRCLFCGRRADFIEVFIPGPEHQRRVVTPPGKERAFCYCTCRQCAFRPDTSARIEQMALASLRRPEPKPPL
jgi:hypothetical protein